MRDRLAHQARRVRRTNRAACRCPARRRPSRAGCLVRGRSRRHAGDRHRPNGESEHREPDRLEVGGLRRGAPAPEVELAEFFAAGVVDHREVDPAADPQLRAAATPWAGRDRVRGASTGRAPNSSTYQRAACASTACSSGSSASPIPAKSVIAGARSSAWMLRTASRNTSRSRARFTGSSERVPPSTSSANRRGTWCRHGAAGTA